MALPPELIAKLESSSSELTQNEIELVKKTAKTNNAYFVETIDSVLCLVKKKEDVDGFITLMELFHKEILSVTHFLTGNINRITLLLLKNHFYNQIVLLIPFLEICGNIKTLESLADKISDLKISKYLTSMEIYQIRKLVFEMSRKLKQSDITYKIEVELQKEDLDWRDHFES